ncbi:MAG: hypothetical protein KF819_36075 [Labilithrix sp.]|nr:hypothetical protein [Labilithrix sp.]
MDGPGALSVVRAALAATALACLFAPSPARAQANYRLAPVGGRTTLVGGTGLAYGSDGASAFLNPATVMRIDSGRLSFSVNFYSIQYASSKTWYRPGPIDAQRFGDVPSAEGSVTSFTFDSLPSSLCLFFSTGRIGLFAREVTREADERARLGVCLATTQLTQFDFDAADHEQSTSSGLVRQAHTINQSFRRFALGPTYAMQVTDDLAVGGSMHFSRAGHRSTFGVTSARFGPQGTLSSIFYSSSQGDSYDVNATLGMTYRMGRQTVAVALESPSVHLYGTGKLSRYTHFEGDGAGTSSIVADGDFASSTPPRLSLGTGVEGTWGSAELNVAIHAPVGDIYSASLDAHVLDSNGLAATDRQTKLALSARARGSMNIGIGGELYMNRKVSLLGGMSTDLSTVPKGSLRGDPFNYFPARTNRLATSFGFASHGDGGDLLFGAELSYAWGERLTVNAYQAPPVLDTTRSTGYGVLFVIAGSTNLKNIRRAVEDVTKTFEKKKD